MMDSTEDNDVTKRSITQMNLEEHEVDVVIEGETDDSQRRFTNCTKNPGHNNFIPFEKLTKDDFPPRYRETDLMLNCVKALADITVKVEVKYASQGRPEGDKYPLSKLRGKHVIMNGSGRVTHVAFYREADGKPCPCPSCKDKPGKEWGLISVLTARHVVYDDSEGKETTCFLTFDPASKSFRELQEKISDDEELRGKTCIELTGFRVDNADTSTDWCRLECCHHNLKLVEFLKSMVARFENLHNEIVEQFYQFKEEDRLAVIVAHPHGHNKYVTIGKWINKNITMVILLTFISAWYSYTADTCPGSSGGPVYLMSTQLSTHAHRGVCDSRELNRSGTHFD